jgi:hypothetical protein
MAPFLEEGAISLAKQIHSKHKQQHGFLEDEEHYHVTL